MEEQEFNQHAANGHNGTGHGDLDHNTGQPHEFKNIEQWIARLDNPEREKKQLPNEVIAKLDLKSGDVLADIGAGTGYFALRIAAAYPQVRVIAADSEPEMVAYLQYQAAERKLANLEPIVIDPAGPELPAKASVALTVNTYHHIDNRVEYLKRLGANMAPGARIGVIDFNMESPEGPPPDHRVPTAQVIDEFNQAGYMLTQEWKFLLNQFFLVFKYE
jgi:cyclopropane fatty-acyl-phospholipid synthase-like methyltransferase